mgnify:CR=1 FL=1
MFLSFIFFSHYLRVRQLLLRPSLGLLQYVALTLVVVHLILSDRSEVGIDIYKSEEGLTTLRGGLVEEALKCSFVLAIVDDHGAILCDDGCHTDVLTVKRDVV